MPQRFDRLGSGRPPARSAELVDETGTLLPAINSFWFAGYTFHPDTLIHRAPPHSQPGG